MEEIVNFLEKNKYGNLATSVGGQPYVRPFEYGFKTDDGFFFYTSNDKKVYGELQNNPKISFCSTADDLTYVQITGDVIFTEDNELKETMLHRSENAHQIYKSADNKRFKVFYMPHGTAILHQYQEKHETQEKF